MGELMNSLELQSILKGGLTKHKPKGYYEGTKKCIGPVPLGKKCKNELSYETNYDNTYCWNCLYNFSKDPETKKMIADEHL